MSGRQRPHVLVLVTAAVTARLFMRGYAEFLAARGYDVTLAAADETGHLSREMEGSNVAVRSIPMKRGPSIWNDTVSLVRTVGLIRELNPDAVLYATPKASLLGSIAGRLCRVPVRIYNLWGIRFETSTGLSRRLLSFCERVIASLSTEVIANSSSLADRASELGIAERSRIHVPGKGSSHGVDAERFAPDATCPPLDAATERFLAAKEGLVVGYIGRLHPDKGVDTLIEAVKRLREEESLVKVLLIGADEGLDGTATLDSAQDSVHVVGEVDDVRPYIKELDVLVLMSRREGFPNVVLEAAAMGVAAVVSDATGCVDSVVNGQTGIIVKTGNGVELANQLKALSADQERLAVLGQKARERALLDFHPTTVWAQLEKVLRGGLLQSARDRDCWSALESE